MANPFKELQGSFVFAHCLSGLPHLFGGDPAGLPSAGEWSNRCEHRCGDSLPQCRSHADAGGRECAGATAVGCLWLVDDASTDHTLALAQELARQWPERVRVEALPRNGGPARARNWGALQAQSPVVAFLDADDAYQPQALAAAALVFEHRPHIGLLRLPLRAVALPERYAAQAEMAAAWRMFEMTTATNTVFNRSFFLASGGWPQHDLFRRLGGEDGALGLATVASCGVATLFDQLAAENIGVDFYCRPGMHAERLFDAMLFGSLPAGVDAAAQQQAQAVTQEVINRLQQLHQILASPERGKLPLQLS